MSQNSVAYEKYLKYKAKYLQLREELYGGSKPASGLTAVEAGILFDAFNTDGNDRLTQAELIANKDSGNLTLEKMAANFKIRPKFASVDLELIKKYCRLITGGSKNWTAISTDDFNKKFAPGGKFAVLVGQKSTFVSTLGSSKLVL